MVTGVEIKDFLRHVFLPFVPPPLRFDPGDIDLIACTASFKSGFMFVYSQTTWQGCAKLMMLASLFYISYITELHALFFIGFGFYTIMTNLGDSAGGASAYSIFNQGARRLAGTFGADQLDNQMRGLGANQGGGNLLNPNAAGGLPPKVAEAAYKWITSKEMEKIKDTAKNKVRYQVRKDIAQDLKDVQEMEQDEFLRYCRGLSIDPSAHRKKAEHLLAIHLNAYKYVNDETEGYLAGFGL
jgi:hypothetical protein